MGHPVSFENCVKVGLPDIIRAIHAPCHYVCDVVESDFIPQIGRHGSFIRRIQDARHIPAFFQGLNRKSERREFLTVRLTECQASESSEIQFPVVKGQPCRISYGILDRLTHVRMSHLGDDSPVCELNH